MTLHFNFGKLTQRLSISIAFLALFVLAGCGGGNEAPQGNNPFARGGDPIAVEVVQAQRGTLPLEQRLSGTAQAHNQVSIFPEISGRIDAVLVDNGDYVQVGAPLVRLNARQYEEQLRQAEAQLKVQQASAEQVQARVRELEAQLRRTEELAANEFASQLELEQQRAQLEAARADYNRALAVVEQAESTVEERREALSQTVVRAPISGHVGRRDAEVGMRVDGSTLLFEIGDLSSMRVRVTLTERMTNFIEVGQTALISSEFIGDQIVEAQVSRISPFLQSTSFSTEATIDVPNNNGLLRSGMFVNVNILYGESEQATLVPNSAIYEDPQTGRMGVFLAPELESDYGQSESSVEGATPQLSDPTPIVYQEIEVRAQGRAMTGVEGISPGDWVVAVGHGLLTVSPENGLRARTRPISWDRLLSLQELQQHDVLQQFMQKQQRIAAMHRDTASAHLPSDS